MRLYDGIFNNIHFIDDGLTDEQIAEEYTKITKQPATDKIFSIRSSSVFVYPVRQGDEPPRGDKPVFKYSKFIKN